MKPPPRIVGTGFIFAGLHFALTIVLFCMGDPLANRDLPPSTQQSVMDFIGHPLTCISLTSIHTPFSLTLMALVADSIIWGFGIAWALRWLRRTLSRQQGD